MPRRVTAAAVASLLLVAAATQNALAGNIGGEMGLPGAGAGLLGKTIPLDLDPQVKLQKGRSYSCSQNWQGSDFFNGWDFFYWPDPTNGMVNYQGGSDAWSKNLISISDQGTALIKVDNWSWLPEGGYRDSIRITSQTPFKKGQMLVIDAVHMPYGCGTWPAFWTVGANWPYGGEIDIIEGVNNQNTNAYTLHTAPGCSISKTNAFAGYVKQESCDAFYNSNTGCGIGDTSTKTYGKGFNNIGGGVFATLWEDDGIYVWFFGRGNIPADLTAGSPKPGSWGKPRAYFSTSNCAIGDFFGDQTIVFDTTLCGDWGGATYSSGGCPGTCAQRVTNPKNFDDAYWEINYVKIFQGN